MMCVTPVQISHYENDKNDIKVSVLKELAKHLNVSAICLLKGETEYFHEEVLQVAFVLQNMPEQLRKVAMEQVMCIRVGHYSNIQPPI